MPSDARTAYLFQCGNEELFAVSADKGGEAIPRSSCTQGWQLRQEFQLGTQDPVPAPIEPEPIIRGINAKGYYIWRDPYWGKEQHIGCQRQPLHLSRSNALELLIRILNG